MKRSSLRRRTRERKARQAAALERLDQHLTARGERPVYWALLKPADRQQIVEVFKRFGPFPAQTPAQISSDR